MHQLFCDGALCAKKAEALLIRDLTFQRGYGAFERLRTYYGMPFELQAHLKRLQRSCNRLKIETSWSFEAIYEMLMNTQYEVDASIRIYVTAGCESEKGHVYLLIEPLPSIDKLSYVNGIHAITTTEKRFLPEVKTTNYAAAQFALRTTKFHQVDEVLFLDEKNCILEGGTSNIFGVIEGKLYTAPEGILPGITRRCISTLFQSELEYMSFRVDQLEECFLTSTIKEVMPITQVDGKPIGNGCVGAKTKQVMQAFSHHIRTVKQPLSRHSCH